MRSAGPRVSRTTRSASPTESLTSAARSGSIASAALTIGSGMCGAMASSRRALRERSMSRQTRATTVVSHPLRFSIPPVPARLAWIQASWTASSASLNEPSMRYATARRRVRSASNRSANQAFSATVTSLSLVSSIESAGTAPRPVHPNTVQILAEVGIDRSRARSKSVTATSPSRPSPRLGRLSLPGPIPRRVRAHRARAPDRRPCLRAQ